MKTGIREYYLNRYGLDEGTARMVEDGYSFIDLSFADTETEYYTEKDEGFLTMLSKKRRELKERGIEVYQIHGPWRYPCDATEEDRAERFEKMTKSLVIAKYLGARYVALHPLMPYGANSPEDPDGVYEINHRFFSALANVASKLGVTVCLENMPFPEFPLSSPLQVLGLIRDINSPALKMCLDVGHANIVGGRISEDIREIGDQLRILHLHDNYGEEDTHNPLFEGTVNWADVSEALYEIGFDGVASLECSPVGDSEQITEEERREREKRIAGYARLIAGV